MTGSVHSQQPNMIVGLVNNTMVFCGLLVAGTITLLATGPISSSFLVKVSTIAALGFSLIGGILSLVSAMYAHNIVRRTEWDEDQQNKNPKRTVTSARTTSLNLAGYAFWSATLGSAAIAFLTISLYFSQSSAGFSGLKISTPNSDSVIEIDGEIKLLKVIENDDGCKIIIRTNTLEIESESENVCVVERQ